MRRVTTGSASISPGQACGPHGQASDDALVLLLPPPTVLRASRGAALEVPTTDRTARSQELVTRTRARKRVRTALVNARIAA